MAVFLSTNKTVVSVDLIGEKKESSHITCRMVNKINKFMLYHNELNVNSTLYFSDELTTKISWKLISSKYQCGLLSYTHSHTHSNMLA